MFYCYVEGNTVKKGPMVLPRGWRNLSGLHHLNQEQLAELGWLPVTGTQPDYNEDTQRLDGVQYAISQTAPEVVRVWPIVDLTPEEIAEKALSKWKAKMEESDKIHMDRALEEHIEFDHNGNVSSPTLQNKYNAKKALRATRPGA